MRGEDTRVDIIEGVLGKERNLKCSKTFLFGDQYMYKKQCSYKKFKNGLERDIKQIGRQFWTITYKSNR